MEKAPQKFKVGDYLTYKDPKDCKGGRYYYSGEYPSESNRKQRVLKYNEYIFERNCWEIRVRHTDGDYAMLEDEFEEYDDKHFKSRVMTEFEEKIRRLHFYNETIRGLLDRATLEFETVGSPETVFNGVLLSDGKDIFLCSDCLEFNGGWSAQAKEVEQQYAYNLAKGRDYVLEDAMGLFGVRRIKMTLSTGEILEWENNALAIVENGINKDITSYSIF